MKQKNGSAPGLLPGVGSFYESEVFMENFASALTSIYINMLNFLADQTWFIYILASLIVIAMLQKIWNFMGSIE